MPRTLNVGVIGAHWTGTYHVPAWRLIPDVNVTAICTTRPETANAAGDRLGIEKRYWNVNEMIADPDLDIIDVGTKPSQRYAMVMAALNAGKHVYNCLPFATDAAKAAAMSELARTKGLVGVVDAQWRWTPAIRRMKEMIEEGAIGRFFTATIHLQLALYDYDGFTYTECTQSATTAPYHWLCEESSGASAWRNFGSHTILNLMYLFGEIEEVVGVTEMFVKELHFPDGTRIRPQTPDFGLALVRFKNGGLANINVSWAMADAPGYALEVCGSKGRMLAKDDGFCELTTTLYHGDASRVPLGQHTGRLVDIPRRLFEVEGTDFNKDTAPIFVMPLAALFADMARVIRTGAGDGSPSFAEAEHAHRAVEGVVQSMKTRGWVRVADVS